MDEDLLQRYVFSSCDSFSLLDEKLSKFACQISSNLTVPSIGPYGKRAVAKVWGFRVRKKADEKGVKGLLFVSISSSFSPISLPFSLTRRDYTIDAASFAESATRTRHGNESRRNDTLDTACAQLVYVHGDSVDGTRICSSVLVSARALVPRSGGLRCLADATRNQRVVGRWWSRWGAPPP